LAEAILLSSTTTSLGRVRGFTVELLFHLKDGSLRLSDLNELTGKQARYIQVYLFNMRNYGLVDKKDAFWELTDLGRDFTTHLTNVNNNIKDVSKKEERSIKEISKKEPQKLKQVRFDLWLSNCNLSETEKEVVEVLTRHYGETGSKFILVKNQFELAEKLGKNPDVLLEALKRLVQDNIIYLFRSQLEGHWKIGLKKAFVEALQKQEP